MDIDISIGYSLKICRWTNVELVPKQFAWAGRANWLFSSYTKDVSFWTVLGTL